MGKWLVVYSSVTGNTKKIAQAMASAAKEADLLPIGEVPDDLSSYEVVAVGYWLWRGGPDPKTAAWLPKVHDAAVVLFETHAAENSSEHAVTAFARAAYLLGENCRVMGTFGCQGQVNPTIAARHQRMAADDPHAKAGGWRTAVGHPDTADLKDAAAFVGRIREKLQRRRQSQEKIPE